MWMSVELTVVEVDDYFMNSAIYLMNRIENVQFSSFILVYTKVLIFAPEYNLNRLVFP